MYIITMYSSVQENDVCMLCYPKLDVESGRDVQDRRQQATRN